MIYCFMSIGNKKVYKYFNSSKSCSKLTSLAFYYWPGAFSPLFNFLPYTSSNSSLSRIWLASVEGSLQAWLATLNAIQTNRRCSITSTLDSLVHRRAVSTISVFYRYYYGVCSDQIKSTIPAKASYERNTRFSNIQYTPTVKLDTNRTNAFTIFFVPMTSRDWNSSRVRLPYNFQSFKTHIHIISSTLTQSLKFLLLLLFTMEKSFPDYRDFTFLVWHLLVSESL